MAADGRDSPSQPLDGLQVARDIIPDVREPKAGEPRLWKPLGGARSSGGHRRSFSIGSDRRRPGLEMVAELGKNSKAKIHWEYRAPRPMKIQGSRLNRIDLASESSDQELDNEV
ncbi:hypothetical protein M5K25_016397 [Dendrobium thyrsiflorum]|uniref:Uncharacterized protein n=1 Tax=Dendrobium thyrsiflorum TaxID=117978 RepID=A0ABD0URX6_DENTH